MKWNFSFTIDNVAGKLIFYQTDGNTTFVRDTGELASDVATETMFELFDPQKSFSKAMFTYTWDLGNGEVIQGTEPLVRYNYSESGNYTLRLKIGVNMTKYTPPITGVYSTDVQVLVDGSPPMWVCWHFLPKCKPDIVRLCTLTMLHGNTLRLNHTFTSIGVHCLDISVHNDISKLQTSFSLYVRRNNYNHVIFILSCVAILAATFCFIAVIACRPRHHSKQRILASSNAVFLKNQEVDGQSIILFNLERGEKRPLLTPGGPQYLS
ncbi:transmembrane protein 130 [Thalassophryne amazonica]|uniref:transmembrane protein 130 n=1 Tax=Thalassophryne amazonica TaxID=390379 RepID=UPI0014723EE5|nr:transmembrane protein 130 [Thalassophryne amazonica]